MLDHSAGLATAGGAEPVVFHPGFLLGRTREAALDDVVEQLAELRERLEAKGRAVPLGVEVMGRVRELGSLEDVLLISGRLPWVRPVLDFAHLHAVSDGAFVDADAFAVALAGADRVLEPGAPFHVHFSDIAYANRNETKHLPYGEGTLRAEPLREALATLRPPGNRDLGVARRGEPPGDRRSPRRPDARLDSPAMTEIRPQAKPAEAPIASPKAPTAQRTRFGFLGVFGWLGIIGIGAAVGAILGALDVAGWITGLAVAATTVALGFFLRRSLAG